MKLIYLINETNLRISTQKRADWRGFVSGISELPATLKDDSAKHEQTEKRHKSQPHI